MPELKGRQALVFNFQSEQNYRLIAGVDEVGRGPLAGDVVAAAVILDPDAVPEGLADSKAISEYRREALFDDIVGSSLSYGIGRATAIEIDQLNILQASLLAMQRAVEIMRLRADFIYVDGHKLPTWPYQALAVKKGDSKILSVAAASILAKVTRDREMLALDRKFPAYGFARHKGYPTAEHRAALATFGPCAIHRKSFAPVARVMGKLQD